MTPRRAGPADLATIGQLTAAAYAPYTVMFGAPPLPVTEDYAPRLARSEVWLLEDAGAAVALVVLERRPDHLMIYSLAVAPDRQGQGHGRRLLALAEDEARAAGLAELRLFTNSRMARNIALYERFGYQELGRRPNPTRSGWVLVDMAKRLPHTPAAQDVTRNPG